MHSTSYFKFGMKIKFTFFVFFQADAEFGCSNRFCVESESIKTAWWDPLCIPTTLCIPTNMEILHFFSKKPSCGQGRDLDPGVLISHARKTPDPGDVNGPPITPLPKRCGQVIYYSSGRGFFKSQPGGISFEFR